VLDVRGYYEPLAAMLDHAVQEGFLRSAQREALLFAGDPVELLERFEGWSPPAAGKWLDRSET
jgi:predicted Rossmann-fold nucleotide-binding protein